jgi:uncharacterized peroxidase-related enzyme
VSRFGPDGIGTGATKYHNTKVEQNPTAVLPICDKSCVRLKIINNREATLIDPKDRAIALHLEQDEPLTEAQEKYLAVCDEKLGFVPNVLKAFSFNPAKFQAFSDMYNDLMLGPSGLSKLEREMIAVAGSSINHCYYCLTAHGAAVRQLSGDPKLGDEIVMNYRAADLSGRHKAMLDFATLLTESPEAIEEEDRQELRDAGFSDRDIWDISAVVGFFNMTNRMATAVDMRPNDEYHYQARKARQEQKKS